MATEKKYLSFDKLQKYDGKIKEVISAGDAATLKSAKDYADGLADNYEVAGEVAKAKTELQGKIDAVDTKADKNTEDIAAINHETTGILKQAKDYADGKVATVQGEVDTLEGVVGTLPTEGGYTSVVDMVEKKTANIASDDTVGAIDNRLKIAEGEIDTLQGLVGETAVGTQIDNKIEALKLDATYEVKGAAEAVQGETESTVKDVEDALGLVDGRVESIETQITGLSGAMHFKGVKNALPEDVSGYEAGDVIIVGEKEYVFNDGAFVEFGDVSAEGDRITALEAHKTTYEAKVNALEGKMTTVEGAVANKAEQSALAEAIETLEGVDTALDDRLKVVEGAVGETGSVSAAIEAAKEAAIDAAAADATDKANQALADAKKHADDEDAKIEASVTALGEVVDTKASQSDLEALTGRVTTVEGKVTTLEGKMTAVESKATENATAIVAANAEIAKKAAQTDLEAAVARIAANEAELASFVEISDTEINSLFPTQA